MIDAKSTSGEEIRNENVTPNGKPDPVKPMKSGIEEQEQNGVIVPNNAARILAVIPSKRPKIFLRPLRREETLHVWNRENQNRQQDEDFDDVVDEEMDAAAHPAGEIQSEDIPDKYTDQIAEPLHF